MASAPEDSNVALTIGHSTRPLEELIGLLKAHAVTRLVDVRTVHRAHDPERMYSAPVISYSRNSPAEGV